MQLHSQAMLQLHQKPCQSSYLSHKFFQYFVEAPHTVKTGPRLQEADDQLSKERLMTTAFPCYACDVHQGVHGSHERGVISS